MGQYAPLPLDGEPKESETSTTRLEAIATGVLMLLPGILIAYAGFNSGGYFAQTPAIAAIVVALVLLVRTMQSRDPFDGLSPVTLVAVSALALYALMTLASGAWSHSTSRALIEFDRAWMYLLVLVLFGTLRPRRANLRLLIWGIVVGASAVCLAGLTSRVLPHVWPTSPGVANERLSFPVTYWNALGLLAAIAALLAFHLTCSIHENRIVRALAAAVFPLLIATIFFTFSRGAIAAGLIGGVIYVTVGRPKALIGGAIATLPATAVLVAVAYHANLLDTADPTTPAAVSQGHTVAIAAAICVLVCAGLRLLLVARFDGRPLPIAAKVKLSARSLWGLAAGSAVLIIAIALALGAAHGVEHDWHRFFSGAKPQGEGHDLRQRLTDPSNDGRTDLWSVALNAFSKAPTHGYGAGMYETLWDHNRNNGAFTINAHSLYLQAMAELGAPGLAFLLILVGALVIGLAVRARGPQRSAYGVLLAVAVTWALTAGADWDWEMPVTTLGVLAGAGLALGPRGGRGLRWLPSATSRTMLGILCLFSIVTPVLIIASENGLSASKRALYVAKNCVRANSDALDSIKWLDVRPEPYEILGLCDIDRGEPRAGVAAMNEAVMVDPGNWETYYVRAIAKAAAGIDPRPDAARAHQMNPLEPLTSAEVRAFKTRIPAGWVSQSTAVQSEALASSELSIVPS
jgi:O-antigen ligase